MVTQVRYSNGIRKINHRGSLKKTFSPERINAIKHFFKTAKGFKSHAPDKIGLCFAENLGQYLGSFDQFFMTFLRNHVDCVMYSFDGIRVSYPYLHSSQSQYLWRCIKISWCLFPVSILR
ncbi:hypothetical protein BC343_06765 [Mucilaginibacter pedocola]|uniref:Uncharacterized protein n=1 Tax=Mucilaginibacter pedocola TaxID=1792845 RepID=A0A1S9PFV8_9SPHI|nr:hypothetical protein BC343_06765 [Mucilaginibacter pedocola]